MECLLRTRKDLIDELEELLMFLELYDSSFHPKIHYYKEKYRIKIKELEKLNILIETMNKLQSTYFNE